MTGYKITATSKEGQRILEEELQEWNRENWRNKTIFKTIFKRTITQTTPLTLKIELKTNLPINTTDLMQRSKEELEKKGLKEEKDFLITSLD